MAISTGGVIAANCVCNKFSGVFKVFFGSTRKGHTEVNYDGIDTNYYDSSMSKEELNTELNKLGDSVAEEGIVVLEKGNMPYSTDVRLNLFSKSSIDFVFGGTGSGAANGQLNLKQALEKSNYKINEVLWNFYETGKGKNYHRGIGAINYGDNDDFAINEVPLSLIKSDAGVVNSFKSSETGVFILSRTGGEGNDLARGMAPYVNTDKDLNANKHPDAQADKYKSYLQPDSVELEVMKFINDNFSDFVLIVNCNNAMELDFAKQFDKLSTIIQVPATGENGLGKLGEILSGKVSSSGRLADTFVKDSFAIPSSQNIGDFEYLVNGKKVNNILGKKNYGGLYYMYYDESIYVGYKYFETRYADLYLNANRKASSSSWKYEDNVIYPFGYGDSLSEFEYSNFSVSEVDGNYEIQVDVKNISDLKGKNAVELYVSSPYTSYEESNGVEKSAIELVDFAKTNVIEPNGSETVKFTVSKDQLLNYNTKEGQYYLSGGDFYFTIGYDAHSAVNNVLKSMGYLDLVPSPSETIAGDTNLVKKVTVEQDLESYKSLASNQFDFVDANKYDADHKYLSRQDWEATYPKIEGEVSNIASIHSERTTVAPNGDVGSHEFVKNIPENYQVLVDTVNFETKAPDVDLDGIEVKWNQKTNLDTVDLRGLDISDPRYDEVVNAISLNDAVKLFGFAGYETIDIDAINKPKTFDTDGPAGFNTVSGHAALGFSYPCSLIIAQTWNKDLMHKVGEGFGRESILLDVQGWYGPTANIHRSPFGGRNFEYFSEDSVLTGEAARQEVHGAATFGLYSYLKHFALNEQETHREKENGVCIFANEQTIREIYLKPFKKAIVDNKVDETYYEIQRDEENNLILDANGNPTFIKKQTQIESCTAIMSSFSRLGGVWAGSCYPLLNNLLREEWGFKGMVLTDYFHDWMMKKDQSLKGGGTVILDPQSCRYKVSKSDKLSQYRLHEATKNVLYTISNSNSVNGYIHGVKFVSPFYYYILIQIGLNAVFAAGLIVSSIFLIKCLRKKEKHEIA